MTDEHDRGILLASAGLLLAVFGAAIDLKLGIYAAALVLGLGLVRATGGWWGA
jgi:hypothetical protein